MTSLAISFVLMLALQNQPATDGRTLFALFEKYHAAFRDVSFVYEGTMTQVARTAGKDPEPGNVHRFQGFYAYRADGATLMDVFGVGPSQVPESRVVYAMLHNRQEIIDASPDLLPPTPLRDRVPVTAPGGPGSLSRPNSPERIFLAYYYPTLGDPSDHEIKIEGWEDIEGRRCLKVRMLKYARPMTKGAIGGLPAVRLWVDLERDACPLRFEFYQGDDLEVRSEISHLERLTVSGGRALWLPAAGTVSVYLGQNDQGSVIHSRNPVYVETHGVLVDTVKFNQGLNDNFFSAPKHAVIVNDEGLRKLQRALDQKPKPEVKKPPADPESRQQRLDLALKEADRQAQRLEASSAARAGPGWFEALTAGLGLFGALVVSAAFFWYRRAR